jgi:hypothetical protein
MKWTPVDSHGPDVVLKPLTIDRVLQVLEMLQNGSYGSTQTSLRQADHHTDGARRHSQPLKALLAPAGEEIGSCFCPFGESAK